MINKSPYQTKSTRRWNAQSALERVLIGYWSSLQALEVLSRRQRQPCTCNSRSHRHPAHRANEDGKRTVCPSCEAKEMNDEPDGMYYTLRLLETTVDGQLCCLPDALLRLRNRLWEQNTVEGSWPAPEKVTQALLAMVGEPAQDDDDQADVVVGKDD